jgi:membrane protease YdiL (CAAX protease family)
VAVYVLLLPLLGSPGFDAAALARLLEEPSFVFATLIVQDSIMAGVALDQSLFRKRLTREELGLARQASPKGAARQFGVGLLGGVLAFALSAIAMQILIDAAKAFGTDLGSGGLAIQPRVNSLADYGFWVGSGVVIAPIAEEVFFRGYALGGFAKRGLANRGLLITSALFAAVHLDALAFGPLLVAGLILGGLRLKTGSLVAPIAAHAMNNFLVVTLTLLGL